MLPTLAAATSSSPISILKKDIDELWRAASLHALGGVESLAVRFMPAQHMQKEITLAIEQRIYDDLVETSLGAYQQAICRSLSAGPHSGAFLTVLPTEKAYRMSDEHMRLAFRHRLGMLPAVSLLGETCISCHARNSVRQPEFISDPQHFEACIGRNPHGTSITSRHHAVAAVLGTLARSVGYSVIREPTFGSIVVKTPSIDPTSGASIEVESLEHDLDRGDLLLIRGDERLLVDVTVVRPTATTHLRNSHLSVTTKGLSCAAAADKMKHVKYDSLCAERGWKMTSFAVESYGSLGVSARQLLHTLASKSDDMSGAAFLQHATASLSIALHSANARIAQGGMQRLRVEQLSADLPMSPGVGSHVRPSRRRITRHWKQVHSAKQVDLSAAFHSAYAVAA